MSKSKVPVVAGVRPGVLAALAAVSIATISAPAGAAGDFIAFGVTQFGGPNQGECDSSHLWWTTRQADNIYEVFDQWTQNGDWQGATKKKNQDVDGEDFNDATKWAPGKDDRAGIGCDSGDVCFLSTHGNAYYGNPNADPLVYWVMGDNSTGCQPSSPYMLYGNTGSSRVGDTEILIVDACNSGQYEVWQESSYPGVGFFDFVDSSSSMSTYLAYNGLAPDRYAFIDGYAEDVYSDGVGIDWLLEAYDAGNMGGNQDTCPVAIVFGETGALRDAMFDFGGFGDRKDTGSRDDADYYVVFGCNPEDGSPVSQ